MLITICEDTDNDRATFLLCRSHKSNEFRVFATVICVNYEQG
jgi:hypothetical protein